MKFAATRAVATVSVDTTKARADLKAFKGDVGHLSATARLDLQMAGATAKLEAFHALLLRLSAMEATPRVVARIGDTVAQIDRVEARLAKLSVKRAEPGVHVEARDALDRLREIEAALTIAGGRNVTARVKVKIDDGLAALKVLRREMEHTLSGGIGARPLGGLIHDVERVGLSLEQVGAQAATFAGRVAIGLTSIADGAVNLVTTVGSGVGRAAVRSIELFGAAFIILVPLIALAAPFVLSLVGACVALVSVFVAATAGAGALGVALVGAFGPVAAVIAFVAYQITKVIQAQKQQSAAVAAAKNALVSQQQAEANLAQAQTNRGEQRIAALVAERDAVLALEVAQNGVKDADLNVEGSKLRLQRARIELANFKKDAGVTGTTTTAKLKNVATGKSGILDGAKSSNGKSPAETALDYRDKLFAVKSALQGVEDAEVGVDTAQSARGKAQSTLIEFQKKGLRAFSGYASALRQVATAERALSKATTTLVESEHKRDAVLGSLSPMQKRFADGIKEMGGTIKTALGPAADEVFAALSDVLKDFTSLVEDPTVQLSLRDIGAALADVVRILGASISTRGFKDAFSTLAEGGASLTRVFGGQVLPDVLRLLLAIAREALPSLKSGAHGLADSFHGFVDAEINGGKLHRQIGFIVGALKSVGRFGGAALGVLAAAFPVAAVAGKRLLDTATKFLDRLKETLGTAEGKDKLKKFFDSSVDSVRTLYHLMKDILAVIKAVLAVQSAISDPGTALLGKPSRKNRNGLGAQLGGAINEATDVPAQGLSLLKKLLGLPFGADGGIATGPVIAGEAGHEALVPLRADVLSRLGRAISAYMPQIDTSFGVSAPTPTGTVGGGGRHQTNYINVKAPPGEWPDMRHAMAEILQRLAAIGA